MCACVRVCVCARLPWMLEGWEVVDVVGWEPELLTAPADWRRTYEPVFVPASSIL